MTTSKQNVQSGIFEWIRIICNLICPFRIVNLVKVWLDPHHSRSQSSLTFRLRRLLDILFPTINPCFVRLVKPMSCHHLEIVPESRQWNQFKKFFIWHSRCTFYISKFESQQTLSKKCSDKNLQDLNMIWIVVAGSGNISQTKTQSQDLQSATSNSST